MARGGLYRVPTRSGILSATNYNEDHNRHLENLYPEKIDDLAENLDMFNTEFNPYSEGVVQLPRTLAEELGALRHQIREITGRNSWYLPVDPNKGPDLRTPYAYNHKYNPTTTPTFAIPDPLTDAGQIANPAGLTLNILPKWRAPGGLTAGQDFITEFTGTLSIEVTTTGYLGIDMVFVHFADSQMEFSTTRSSFFHVFAGEELTIPLVMFNSRVSLGLGQQTTEDGTNINVTQTLLDSRMESRLDLVIKAYTSAGGKQQTTNTISRATLDHPQVTYYQLAMRDSRVTVSSGTGVSLSDEDPLALATTATEGTASDASRSDHVHPLPAAATTSAAGLMSSTDKTKLDSIESSATTDQTATEVRDLLAGLSGTARLPATAIRDIQTGTSGLTQVEVDARVDAKVPAVFRVGNTALISTGKLGSGTASNTRYLRGDGSWQTPPDTGLNQAQVDSRITTQLPTVTSNEATGGSSTARRAWTSARVRAAINAVVPSVFRSGNTSRIGTAKLGSGTASSSTFLRGDGSWQSPPTGGSGLNQAAVDARILAQLPTATNQQANIVAGGTDRLIWTQTRLGEAIAFVVPQVYRANNTDRIPVAKLGTGTPSSSNYLRGDGSWQAVTGGGSGLTQDQVDARITARLPVERPRVSRTEIDTGTSTVVRGWAPADARRMVRQNLEATYRMGNTNLIPTAKLGTGTASNTTYLRGDGTWQVPPATSGSGLSQAQVDARIDSKVPSVFRSTSDVIPVARLGTGTPSNSNYLRGDGTWQAVSGGSGLSQAQVDARITARLPVELPTVSSGDATSGTATARRAWTAALVRSAINAVVPAVFRSGNTSRIATSKLGTGTGSSSNFLRGDGSWQTPSTGLSQSQVDSRITNQLPTISSTDATGGTSTARRAWTSARVRSAINAVVPTVFRSGNTSLIGTGKLGTGTASSSTYLRGDGSWQSPPTGGSGLNQTAVDARITARLPVELPTVSSSDATTGTATARRAWTAALVRAAINAVVPAVFRSGSTALIGTGKLGSGTASSTTFLRGDGSWQTPPTGTSGLNQNQVDARITAQLPTASTNQAAASSGTDRVIWTVSRLRAAMLNYLPLVPANEAEQGTSSTIRAWTSANVRAAINSVVPAVFRSGNTSVIGTAKLGTGTASSTTYLRGDGSWATVTGGSGLNQAAVDARITARLPVELPTATNTQATELGTSDHTRLVWSPTRLKQLVQACLPLPSSGDLSTPTSTSAKRWSPANISAVASISVPDVFRRGNNAIIPTAKLGSGTANNVRFLRGDGTWAAVTAGAGQGLTQNQVDQRITDQLPSPPLNSVLQSSWFLNNINRRFAWYPNALRNFINVCFLGPNQDEINTGTKSDPTFWGVSVDAAAIIARLPTATAQQAAAVSGSDRLAWTVTRLRTLVGAVVPAVFRTGNTSRIPVAKLGTGTPSSSNFLRGDGVWTAASGGGATITFGTTTTLTPHNSIINQKAAHGLGGIPNGVEVWLECVQNDAGWVSGERIPLTGRIYRRTISYDATNVYFRQRSSPGAMQAVAPSSTDPNDVSSMSSRTLTFSRWRWKFRAYRIT